MTRSSSVSMGSLVALVFVAIASSGCGSVDGKKVSGDGGAGAAGTAAPTDGAAGTAASGAGGGAGQGSDGAAGSVQAAGANGADAASSDTGGGTDVAAETATAPKLVDVSVAGGNACALRPTGTVACWGPNTYGLLGDGTLGGDSCPTPGYTYLCRTSPVAAVGLTDVVSVDVGEFHGCAIKSDGTLWCWGRNAAGELGHSGGDASCTAPQGGTVACNPTPTQVTSFPAGTKIAQVSCGLGHTCAVTGGGDVYCWGDNTLGILGAPLSTASSASPLRVAGLSSGAAEVRVAIDHAYVSCARLVDTSVWCWGQSDSGALGHDPTNDPMSGGHTYHLPAPVVDAQNAPFSGVTELGVGSLGACVLTADGTVWCWGSASWGVLGNATSLGSQFAPQKVVLGLPKPIVALARRDLNVLALDKDGNVWSWGRNNYAQVGDGTVVGDGNCGGAVCKGIPAKLPGLTGVKRIAIGEANGFVVLGDGTVWGWGENSAGGGAHAPNTNGDGACGAGSSAGSICNPTPKRVAGLP